VPRRALRQDQESHILRTSPNRGRIPTRPPPPRIVRYDAPPNKTSVEAEKLLRQMWSTLCNLTSYVPVYDSDIEERINAVVDTIGINYNHRGGLHIYSGHWPEVKQVARWIITQHLKDESITNLSTVATCSLLGLCHFPALPYLITLPIK
jgi:hypothetical protein